MAFTHGIWFDKEHHQIFDAVEVGQLNQNGNKHLQALCTTRHVRHRGDTLNKPTITLKVSSVAPGVIAHSAVHFRGAVDRNPRFDLFPNGNQTQNSSQTGQDIAPNTVDADGLRAVLDTKPDSFRLEYRAHDQQQPLTSIGHSSLQYVVVPPGAAKLDVQTASTTIADPYYRKSLQVSKQAHMAVAFDLDVGEKVYGLGERFGPLVKNGQTLHLWNEDAGTASLASYKNVPFYLTNRGYGVFFDHTECITVEVQTERLGKVQVSVVGEELRWYLLYGPSPKEILRRYALLTGRAALPPPWSFGLYLSTSFLTDYSEPVVMEQLDLMKQHEVPVSVFHFDCFWMKAHNWTNFEFDPEAFPTPKATLSKLHDRGIKVCVWINAYIAQAADAFTEAMEAGYLIKRRNGDVWQSDIWQAGMAIVDFTNPKAVGWYQDKLRKLIRLGVDSFKTDFGERIPWEDVEFYNGMDPAGAHNYYSHLYNKTVYDVLVQERGANEAALFARSGTAGGQQFPVHWGGDCLSGFAFWSHDIGGFMSEGQASTMPSACIYKRWVQFGLLSSHSRLHGSRTYRVPWLIDEEACLVLSKFTRLKNMLMPYLYSQAIMATRTGLPMMRAMFIEFPDDIACENLDLQYMLGDSLLVAPVTNESGWCDYYVPAGSWTGLLDGRVRTGPAFFHEHFDNLHLPLLVRQDRAIPIGTHDRPDYAWSEKITRVVLGACSEKHVELCVPKYKDLGELETLISLDVTAERVDTQGAGQVPVVKLAPDNCL